MVRERHWFKGMILTKEDGWKFILLPFILSRLVWEVVAWFAAGNLAPNPTYHSFAQRGYFLTRFFPVDVFARWDARHYFSILQDGYSPSSSLTTIGSNLAFFPLYPMMVKSFGWLGFALPDGVYIALGVLLSNLFFLGAVVFLYQLAVCELGYSPQGTKRAILLIFSFPTSFFFSSFYPESLFLLLSITAFLAAYKRKWWLAGILSGLAVLTRFQGVFLAAALFWLYFEQSGWKRERVFRPQILWPLLPLGAFSGFFLFLAGKTGRLTTMIEVQQSWGRFEGAFWQGLLENLNGPGLDVFKIDLLMSLGFILCALFMMRKAEYRPLGLYVLLMVLFPLASGSLISMGRFLAVLFPVFLFIGESLHRAEGFVSLAVLWFALQIVYFASWVNYYWIA